MGANNLLSFTLLILLGLLVSIDGFSFRTGRSTGCIRTGLELIAAIAHAPLSRPGEAAYPINICSARIYVVDNTGKGIDVSKKNIALNCALSDPTKKCILDGKMSTRILYGESAQLSVERIRFSNGKADKGGAMYFTGQSSVTINKGCLFADNVATTGGAIYMDTSSTLVIQGAGIIVHSALAVVFKNNNNPKPYN